MFKRRKDSRDGCKNQNYLQGVCTFVMIPPEMFISICQYLPPIDLLSLAQVSRLFNNYLCAESSSTTQEIWRASRTAFLPFLQMPPPNGMTERKYVKLILERGCQFCKKPKIRKVFWEFCVRCCEECLKERTFRHDTIHNEIMQSISDSDNVISGLTYTSSWSKRDLNTEADQNPSSLYWRADVLNSLAKYKSIPNDQPSLKRDWINQQRKIGETKMNEVFKRKKEYNKGLQEKANENSQKRYERARLIGAKIRAMKDEKDENNCSKFNFDALKECQTYKNYIYNQSRQSILPFTDRAWVLLKNKLLKEYDECLERKRRQQMNREMLLSEETVFQLRQYDIYELAKIWLSESFTKTDTSIATDSQVMNSIVISADLLNEADNTVYFMGEPESLDTFNTISNPIGITSDSMTTKIKSEDIINLDKSDTYSLSINTDIKPLHLTTYNTRAPSTSLSSCPSRSSSSSSVSSCSTIDSDLSNFISPSIYNPHLQLDYHDASSTLLFYDMHSTFSSFSSSTTISDSCVRGLNEWVTVDMTNSLGAKEQQYHLIQKYLPWCPSFRNPPFHEGNPYNLWQDEFLRKTLMPIIWSEALELQRNSGPLQSVQQAVLGGYRENNMFRCKLCKNIFCRDPDITSYSQIRNHIYNDHMISHILDEEMIEFVHDFDGGMNFDPFSNDTMNFLCSIGYNFRFLNFSE